MSRIIENEHWTATADRVTDGDPRILGEDERGDLWVPRHTQWARQWVNREPWWDRRFNPRNPLHWRFWARSRFTNRIAFLEITR